MSDQPARQYSTSPISTDKMPPGIPFIVGNEAAERFSYYGMNAILSVFMTKYLVDASGRMDWMSDNESNKWTHLFGMAAYAFPILGALLSDGVLGKFRTIVFISMFYCVGHLVLAINDFHFVDQKWGLAIGLILIAAGAGGIKPCVSAHVGDQFGEKNKHLLGRAFGWFYFSINFGSFFSQLLIPFLLANVGAWAAFGLPGVLMFIATAVFWVGRYRFAHIPPAGLGFIRESLSGDGRRAMLNLVPLYLFVAVFWSLYDQSMRSWVLQAERLDRRLIPGVSLPLIGEEALSSQIQAVNPILIMLMIPLFSYVIYPLVNRVVAVTPLRKVAVGFFLTAASFALVAWLEAQITGGRAVKTTSVMDPELWHGKNLIDGTAKGNGWASAVNETRETYASATAPPPEYPQDILISLRENRAWKIGSVKIHPAEKEPTAQWKGVDVTVAPGGNRAKEIAILVGEKRKDAKEHPWREVARATLSQDGGAVDASFSAVETPYVIVRVLSNWGGPLITLGEVEVFADDAQPPAIAHPHARDVWPNVAAAGFKPSVLWQILAYVILTAAEVLVSITCLDFSYSQAPRKMKSFVMALYLLSVSGGNLLVALVNHFIQNEDGSSKLPGAGYFWFFTVTMLAASVLFLFYAPFYRGKTYIQE